MGNSQTGKLTRDGLFTLEHYAGIRSEFRRKVMAHKRDRQVQLGGHLTLYFEDRLTMQYQIQEMLRAERIFEPKEIEAELDTYNPLIPDGSNWKATLMLEYTEVDERRRALAQLVGIEERVWIRVQGCEPVYATADEDLERATEEKTSAVHFLRFELDADMVHRARDGAEVSIGVDHPDYRIAVDRLPENIRASLVGDLH